MLTKPDGCVGCPLYDDGMGFVPDEIVEGAKVVVLLQNPGQQEERMGKPAVGATGEELNTVYLPTAGLERGKDVSVANALRCRWRHCPDKKTGKLVKCNHLPTGKVLYEALRHCRKYDAWPPESRLIVACGAAAWAAIGGPGKVSEWRGFPAPESARTASEPRH